MNTRVISLRVPAIDLHARLYKCFSSKFESLSLYYKICSPVIGGSSSVSGQVSSFNLEVNGFGASFCGFAFF